MTELSPVSLKESCLYRADAALRDANGDIEKATAALFQEIAPAISKLAGADKGLISEAVCRGCEAMVREAHAAERARIPAESADRRSLIGSLRLLSTTTAVKRVADESPTQTLPTAEVLKMFSK